MQFFILVAVAISAVCAADNIVNLASKDPLLAVALFKEFEAQHEKPYVAAERRMRLTNFRKSVAAAAALNEAEEDVEYGITLFADMTDAEVQGYMGVNSSIPTGEEFPMQDAPEGLQHNLQSSFSHKNRYSVVKRQQKNDCWAFSTISVLEGHTAIVNGRYTQLSEQEVVDCTSGSSAGSGGWANQALKQVQNRRSHMATSASYRYAAGDYACKYSSHSNALPFSITGVYQVRGDSGLATALRSGPVSAAAMKFSSDLSRYYKGGVYTNTACNNMQHGNHAVAITGYTSAAFEVRNSWGTSWGDRGYGYISRRSTNLCNVSGYSFYITTRRNGREQEE